ncbi:hypothetical protein GCK72_022393 [Caenorhabditis remanei]|uniref:Uncharacterized protein n=1 Tax=Caenorhabditis remanei TaxID=31234 RepID=A0A6A5FTX9_CAERE|nr:hypothetical protein GCK72_022393 [Caenorhabditis remanei]KAF1745945.1 hypothetical protein GCK72_022393 [Caenorhabditis remanei]
MLTQLQSRKSSEIIFNRSRRFQVVVKGATAPGLNDEAAVQEILNTEELMAGEAVSDEDKTEKAAPVQLSSAEQPEIAEEIEITDAAIGSTPVADIDRRIRSRWRKYSDKDFVCQKPTGPPKKRLKKN